MAYYNSDYSGESFYSNNKNINFEIQKYKGLIEKGSIYSCMEAVEETIQNCIDNEKFEDGLYFVNKLLDIAPYNSEYWLKKGAVLNGLFNFEQALDCYNKALSLNPGDSEILMDKAEAEESLGFYKQAKETLLNAIKL